MRLYVVEELRADGWCLVGTVEAAGLDGALDALAGYPVRGGLRVREVDPNSRWWGE